MFAWRRVGCCGVQGCGKGDASHRAMARWSDRRFAGTKGCGKSRRLLVLPITAGLLRGRELGQTFLRLDWAVQQFAVAMLRASIAFASFRNHIFRFQSFYSFREVVYDPQVKRSGFELDLVTHEFGPFVPSGVDPADEIEVIDMFECAEVCTLLSSVRKCEV